ncbi:MAG: GGDEF domain-containing protein [Candidatus Eremiobacterota bacterium]
MVDPDDLTERLSSQFVAPAPETSVRPCILILTGVDAGRLIKCERPVTVLGRTAEADVVLSDPGISRMHARIVVRPDGEVELADLGSTNGTFVEGNRVERQLLRDGQVISLGPVVQLQFSRRPQAEEELHTRLYETATRDGLTQAVKREHFQQVLEKEFVRSRRLNNPLSVIMLDLDFFKRINDTLGHPAGDEVLRQVARRLLAMARQYDVVARYGGEEFMLLLPQTDAQGAMTFAERARECIEQESIRVPSPTGERSIRVTASFGVSNLDACCFDTPSEMVAAADEALYLSKKDGRNRVTLFRRFFPSGGYSSE